MRHILALVAILSLGVSGAAEAATLFAGPLSFPSGGSVRCFAVNVSSRETSITLTLITAGGTQAAQQACPTVAAGHSCFFDLSNSTANYCRIEVNAGKNSVRAVLEMSNSSGALIATAQAR